MDCWFDCSEFVFKSLFNSQNRDKRKRYNNNKTEKSLSNALTSALSLDTVDSIALPATPQPSEPEVSSPDHTPLYPARFQVPDRFLMIVFD